MNQSRALISECIDLMRAYSTNRSHRTNQVDSTRLDSTVADFHVLCRGSVFSALIVQ